ncbi:hypothetical protein SAMN04244576_05974 [Sinorhizobium meliloti]|nr:hypothetical protein BN406_04103 [Sinorhizobium meliloti Rm41]SDZ44343.1 hypothetical protein SAMN04244576_05974 [Sinorhizobium meliloti]
MGKFRTSLPPCVQSPYRKSMSCVPPEFQLRHNHPPVNPARLSPTTKGSHRRMTFHKRPVL